MTQPESTVHLIKLCVGVQEISQLEVSVQRARNENRDMWISTRMMPKRKDELCAGGSLYWVILGQIQVRQNILKMEMGPTEMGQRAIINLEPRLILTELHPRRPFQGWRYLDPSDAPDDIPTDDTKQNITSARLPPRLESDIKAALAW